MKGKGNGLKGKGFFVGKWSVRQRKEAILAGEKSEWECGKEEGDNEVNRPNMNSFKISKVIWESRDEI